jgi:GDPmannose 4,6-dehydratase
VNGHARAAARAVVILRCDPPGRIRVPLRRYDLGAEHCRLASAPPTTKPSWGVMIRKALVTGVAGQDGTYLAEFLLKSGYEIHGTDNSADGLAKAETLLKGSAGSERLFLHLADSTRFSELNEIIRQTQPTEIYNLAAQTRVDQSFTEPLATAYSVAIGTANLLQAARLNSPDARIFQASSSEMFGDVPAPQNEDTVFAPVSPYASAKVYAHHLAAIHRRSYNMYVCSGILFNHESSRRDPHFVSRKITSGIAQILSGKINTISLGNLAARRDWGHAREYVLAMWLMLQQDYPVDYVIATGVSYTVQEFLEIAFTLVDLDWRDHVTKDPKLLRPADPMHLQGDATRARLHLGWQPTVGLHEMIYEMLRHDLKAYNLDGALRHRCIAR